MKAVFKPIRLSIVIPVLDSHKIVRRQIRYFKRLHLPDDIEIIFIDDGSAQPLRDCVYWQGLKNCYVYPSGDKRPWSIACARNLGIKIAQGTYIFNTDIDHVLTKEAIMAGYQFTGDKMFFHRAYGIIDRRGRIRQDFPCLFSYGLSKERYRKHGLKRHRHTGTHVIRKKIVEELDGYPTRCCDYGTHPTREDRLFYQRYEKYRKAGKCLPAVISKIKVLHFPTSDLRGYFHQLPRGGIKSTIE